MKLKQVLAALAAAGLMISVPAQAGWKLVDHAKAVKVAKGRLTVTAGEDWNRSPYRPIKAAEVWTLDGDNLNELYFVSGLAPGLPLFQQLDKKNNPLPKLSSTMELTDIPDFYESSIRVALHTSLFEVDKVEPQTFAGHSGIKFSFHYSVENSPIVRKGLAAATLVDGQLYMISFVAPSIYYYDRDAPKAEAIIASAAI